MRWRPATPTGACRPCARQAAWPTRPSSNASEAGQSVHLPDPAAHGTRPDLTSARAGPFHWREARVDEGVHVVGEGALEDPFLAPEGLVEAGAIEAGGAFEIREAGPHVPEVPEELLGRLRHLAGTEAARSGHCPLPVVAAVASGPLGTL